MAKTNGKAKPRRKRVKATSPMSKPAAVALNIGKEAREEPDESTRFIIEPAKFQSSSNGLKPPIEEAKQPLIQSTSVRNPFIQAGTTSVLDNDPNALLQRVTVVKSNVAAHQFFLVRDPSYYDLLDEMFKDGPIGLAVSLAVSLILSKPASFMWTSQEDEEDARADDIMGGIDQFLLKVPSRYGWHGFRKHSLKGRLLHGFSAHGVAWDMREGFLAPTEYKHAHPGLFTFDDRGTPFLYRQFGDKRTAEIERFKVAICGSPGMYGNPFGDSWISDRATDYAVKKAAAKAWVLYCDFYGWPLPVGKVNAGGIDTANAQQQFETIFQQMTEVGGVTYNTDWGELEFVNRMAGQSGSPHMELVKYFERVIMQSLLGAVLHVAEAEFGSRAQATVHSDMSRTKLLELAPELEGAANHIVRMFVIFNFGPDAPVPVYRIDMAEPTDQKLMIDIIDACLRWGLDVSELQARELTDIRSPKDDEPILMPPVAPSDGGGQERTEPEDGDDPDTSSDDTDVLRLAEGAQKFAHRKNVDVDVENFFLGKLADIADGMRLSTINELRIAIEAALDRLAAHQAGDFKLTQQSIRVGELDLTTLSVEQLEDAMIAARALGAGAQGRIYDSALPDSIPDADDIPTLYRRGTDWMQTRKIMTKSEVEGLGTALHRIEPHLDADFFERRLREDILALKDSIDTNITRQFRSSISKAVANGETQQEWIDKVRGLLDEGGIPGANDAYLENVFRTESGKIYSQNRAEMDQHPDLVGFIWGYEVYNPDDDRSRPTHGDLDETLFEKGSTAEMALGETPFSFQCRCQKITLILTDPENRSEFSESEDAFEKASRLERF